MWILILTVGGFLLLYWHIFLRKSDKSACDFSSSRELKRIIPPAHFRGQFLNPKKYYASYVPKRRRYSRVIKTRGRKLSELRQNNGKRWSVKTSKCEATLLQYKNTVHISVDFTAEDAALMLTFFRPPEETYWKSEYEDRKLSVQSVKEPDKKEWHLILTPSQAAIGEQRFVVTFEA